MRRARVIANHGAELLLKDADGSRLSVTGKRKHGLIVVGDEVALKGDGASVQIDELLDRDTTLARTDRNGVAKPLAANVTQLVIVCAPLPAFDLLLIDQYLVAASAIGVGAVLVVNKVDLLTNESQPMADTVNRLYRDIGTTVLNCSAQQPDTIAPLRRALQDQVSILVGQSGVGKSTLLTSLVDDPDIRTGAISEQSGLGRHTTTVAVWYDLRDGGAIIDSAGVRQFGLDHLQAVDIQSGFREIATAAVDCRFNDCMHLQEPGCAVREQLDQQRIHASRFNNFCKLRDRSAGQQAD
jgi:ribosome biogenesis GTPase